MRKEILNDLKNAYQPYSEGWKEWTKTKSCNLTDLEKYSMEIYIKNDFEIVLEELMMFYTRNEITEGIINKLKDKMQLFLYGNFLVESYNKSYIEDS
jgi:hypothetical protein